MKPHSKPAARPLNEGDLDRLQALLDAVPAPLDPLDICMLDGFLCGVLLQPQPPADWLRFATDSDGRALPQAFDAKPLHALVRRRHAELAAAIETRQWFDPWVFELYEDGADDPAVDADSAFGEQGANPASQAVYPWVAGFALAMAHFPALMGLDAKAITAPLALLYRHLQADDLEDADELLAEIETLEPPQDLSQAVEELVRATLLLADVSHPRPAAARPAGKAQRPRYGHR